ncbi:MAG: hypothetical protein VKO00_11540 [Cyanobacteriota bacterium]|nr:hypothetical protein [Cyanobacteriota bacterium]
MPAYNNSAESRKEKKSGNLRTLYLHVGIYKTGTTSLQGLLTGCADDLQRLDVLYPLSGRNSDHTDLACCRFAHHNLAWQIGGDPRFAARRGTTEDLRTEIATHPGNVVVSSEDFIAAALKPERFSNFLAGLQQVGFAVIIVIAVREQADFLFSLYSELVCRHQFSIDFSHYLSEAINSQEVTYRHWRFPLDYGGLLEHLKAYGVEVRTLAYNQEARAGGWAASWLTCLDLDSSQLPPPPQLNPSIIESMLTAAEQIKPRLPRYRTDEMEALQRAFKPWSAALQRWSPTWVNGQLQLF